ncbi:M18 family aminopeptidase [Desulforhopalus singaporensis]|uniref:M18 family aminopeptidase n=1 Tax=Desulforhopalus singaporensis TaxID=91360 RepID=A0A1H0PY19_9BACT|nr:M18 family aminopeptidase [Desulforhopalus singaporensis]SDP09406.1 aspartyl aminopeptidase [Desulforhopalus singaporensis]
MDTSLYNQQLFSFLSASPTPFHCVAQMSRILQQHGFTRLREQQSWGQLSKGSYYVVRQQGAITAFTLGTDEKITDGFRIIGAHTDSPCLQLKPKPDVKTGSFHQLAVEVYGGSLLAPWFDRDLSIAGRVCVARDDGSIDVFLVDFARPLVTIPSIAIHLFREANSKPDINQQKHLPPIIGQSVAKQLPDFTEILKDQMAREHPEASGREILGYDLFCYDHQGPIYTGVNNDFISAPRLDNLLSCHAGLTALIQTDRTKNSILFCSNHEENGSLSAAGAQGSFISAVLERIIPEDGERRLALASSFLISADNAHATHPNYPEKTDPGHEIHLNKGPVIKINANQRYTSSGFSSAVYKQLCRICAVDCQEFVMRSDLACGSTIGPMTAARLGVNGVDVGAPTLGMHSIRELTGRRDPLLFQRPLVTFLTSDLPRSCS